MSHGIPLPEILEAVECARERGWKVMPKYWLDRVNGENVCCALGACLVQCNLDARPDYDIGFREVAERLGIEPSWVFGFSAGFDGTSLTPSKGLDTAICLEGHAAGRKALAAVCGFTS